MVGIRSRIIPTTIIHFGVTEHVNIPTYNTLCNLNYISAYLYDNFVEPKAMTEMVDICRINVMNGWVLWWWLWWSYFLNPPTELARKKYFKDDNVLTLYVSQITAVGMLRDGYYDNVRAFFAYHLSGENVLVQRPKILYILIRLWWHNTNMANIKDILA